MPQLSGGSLDGGTEMMSYTTALLVCAVLCAPGLVAAQSQVFPGGVHPSWAPTGTEFVCTTSTSVVRVSSTGALLETIDQNTAGHEVGAIIFHPDGQRVIYLGRDLMPSVGDWNVTVKTLGDGSISWPASGLVDDFGISFYEIGGEVLFDDSNNQVWALNIADGSTRPFIVGVDATVSPDGQWVGYVSDLTDRNVTVEPIAGGSSVVIGQGGFCVWTEDSQQVLFMDGGGDLILASRDGSQTSTLLAGPDFEVAGSHKNGVLAYSVCGAACDVWILNLSTVPTEETTWGAIKNGFRGRVPPSN